MHEQRASCAARKINRAFNLDRATGTDKHSSAHVHARKYIVDLFDAWRNKQPGLRKQFTPHLHENFIDTRIICIFLGSRAASDTLY